MNYNKLKYSVEWQMNRFGLSEKEAEEKIKNMRKACGQSNVYSIEWQMKKYNITREEAENRIKIITNKISESYNNKDEFNRKAISPKNKEHWLKKGYDIKTAKKLAHEQVKHMQSSYQKKKEDNPDNYFASFNVKEEYYIKQGFTKEEAKNLVKERQAVGRLDRFIERYGDEEGKKRWEERQIKWQKTMDEKPQEEKDRINKLKGITLENMIRKWGEVDGTEKYNNWVEKTKNVNIFYSKISQQLFYILLNNISDKENVKFATHNKEKIIQQNNKIYCFDFCYKRKIIEFNGDIYHANPKLFNENDCTNPYLKNLSAKETWKQDNHKINIAKNKGYDILVIWEKDYRENGKDVINKCLQFLNKL